MAKALEHLQRGETYVIGVQPKLGKCFKNLIQGAHDLKSTKLGLQRLEKECGTYSATGNLVVHIFGAIAEFEADFTSKRTQTGPASV